MSHCTRAELILKAVRMHATGKIHTWWFTQTALTHYGPMRRPRLRGCHQRRWSDTWKSYAYRMALLGIYLLSLGVGIGVLIVDGLLHPASLQK